MNTAYDYARAALWLRENGLGDTKCLAVVERAAEAAQARQASAYEPSGIERGCTPERDDEPARPVLVREPCSDAERAVLQAIMGRARGNGITAHELGAHAGITERAARAIVAHLRSVHQLPIAGTPAENFFWPSRVEDLNTTLSSMGSRKREISEAIDGIRAGAARMFGTLNLPGME